MLYPKDTFSHHYWIQNCDRLKYTADLLIDHLMQLKNQKNTAELNQKIRACLEGNLLLLGFAIENLLKGYAIFQYSQKNDISSLDDIPFIKDKIWKIKSGHELTKMVTHTSLNFTGEEMELLKKLEKYISWKGRYHIPQKSDEIEKAMRSGTGDHHSSKDQEIVNSLITRIKQLMTR